MSHDPMSPSPRDEPPFNPNPNPSRRRFSATDSLRMLVPLRNSQAIWAYYLGAAALVPVVSVVLGPVAIQFGRRGIRWAKSDPEGQGLRHAIAGVVMAITGMCVTFLAVLAVVIWWKMAENHPSLVRFGSAEN